MESIEIVKLLPGGAAATAVIVVVILFLKQQEKTNTALKEISSSFHEQSKESQKLFQDQIDHLTTRQYESQKQFQSQVQALIDAHLRLSKETIIAVKALEATVGAMRERMMIGLTHEKK